MKTQRLDNMKTTHLSHQAGCVRKNEAHYNSSPISKNISRAEIHKVANLERNHQATGLDPSKIVATSLHERKFSKLQSGSLNNSNDISFREWDPISEKIFPIRSPEDSTAIHPLFSDSSDSTKLSSDVDAMFEYHVGIPDACITRLKETPQFRNWSESRINAHFFQSVLEIVENYLDNTTPNYSKYYVDKVCEKAARLEPALRNQKALYVPATIQTGEIICPFSGIYGKDTRKGDESYSLETLSKHVISPGRCAGAFANTSVRFCTETNTNSGSLEYDDNFINAFFIDTQVTLINKQNKTNEIYSLVFLVYVEAPNKHIHNNGEDIEVRVHYGSDQHLAELQKLIVSPTQETNEASNLNNVPFAPPRRKSAIKAQRDMRDQLEQEAKFNIGEMGKPQRKRVIDLTALPVAKRANQPKHAAASTTSSRLHKVFTLDKAISIIGSASIEKIVDQVSLDRYVNTHPKGRQTAIELVEDRVNRLRLRRSFNKVSKFLLNKFSLEESGKNKKVHEQALRNTQSKRPQQAKEKYDRIVDEQTLQMYLSQGGNMISLRSWVRNNHPLGRVNAFLTEKFPPTGSKLANDIKMAQRQEKIKKVMDASRARYNWIDTKEKYDAYTFGNPKKAAVLRNWVRINHDKPGQVNDFLRGFIPPSGSEEAKKLLKQGALKYREERRQSAIKKYAAIDSEEKLQDYLKHNSKITLAIWVADNCSKGVVNEFLLNHYSQTKAVKAYLAERANQTNHDA